MKAGSKFYDLIKNCYSRTIVFSSFSVCLSQHETDRLKCLNELYFMGFLCFFLLEFYSAQLVLEQVFHESSTAER